MTVMVFSWTLSCSSFFSGTVIVNIAANLLIKRLAAQFQQHLMTRKHSVIVNGRTGILINPTCELEQIPEAFLRNVPNSVIIDGEFSEPRSVDPKHLAEAIVFLLRNPDVSRKYAQNGHNRAIRLFSMERYVDELENTYMKLAKQKGILQQ